MKRDFIEAFKILQNTNFKEHISFLLLGSNTHDHNTHGNLLNLHRGKSHIPGGREARVRECAMWQGPHALPNNSISDVTEFD